MGIVKEKNLIKYTSLFCLDFFEDYKDISDMRMKDKCGRLMNSDIVRIRVLSKCERGLMKHKLC